MRPNQPFHQNQQDFRQNANQDFGPGQNDRDFRVNLNQQEFRPNMNQQDFRPNPNQQDFRPNQNFPPQGMQDFRHGPKDLDFYEGHPGRYVLLNNQVKIIFCPNSTFR